MMESTRKENRVKEEGEQERDDKRQNMKEKEGRITPYRYTEGVTAFRYSWLMVLR